MRGILFEKLILSKLSRIIPAHAGNTYETNEMAELKKDHPRSCGEYNCFVCGEKGNARIIPAHAGNTFKEETMKLHNEDHPRSCGEYLKYHEHFLT